MADVSPPLANESVSNVSDNVANDSDDENEMKVPPSSETDSSSKTSSSMQLSNGSNISTAGRPFDMISRSNVNNDDATQSRINSDSTHSSNSSANHSMSKTNVSEESALAVNSNNRKECERQSQMNDENSQAVSLTTDVTVPPPASSSPTDLSSVRHRESSLNCQTSDSTDPSLQIHTQTIKIESNQPTEPSCPTVSHSSTSEVEDISQNASQSQEDGTNVSATGNQSEQVKCENVQGNEDDNGHPRDTLNSHAEEIESNSDFSAVCDFFIQFGEKLGISYSIADLKEMLEEKEFVHEELIELHIKLLRKRRKWINRDKWERSLVKFIGDYSQVDAWELEKFGYPAVRFAIKLKILKVLLECQFDFNNKFKSLINSQEASSLRILPIGRDIKGNMYWYQLDEMANIRVYREFIDDESTWTPVCKDKSDLIALIEKLKSETELEPLKGGSSGKTSSSESEEEEEEDEDDEEEEEDTAHGDDASKSDEKPLKSEPMQVDDDSRVEADEPSTGKSASPQPQLANGRENMPDLTSKKLTAPSASASSSSSSSASSSTLPPPPPLIKASPGSTSNITVKIEANTLSPEKSPSSDSQSTVNQCDDVHNCMSDLLEQIVKNEKLESVSDSASAATSLPPPLLIPLPIAEKKSSRVSCRNLRSNSSAVISSLEELSPVKVSRVKVEKVQPEETIESIVQSVCDRLIDDVITIMGEKGEKSDVNEKSSTPRGRRRGRGARGRRRANRGASASASSTNRSPANSTTSKSASSTRQRPALSRELMELNGLAEIELAALHDEASNCTNNNDNSMDSAPRVRQSRRIAKLQEKKTAELAEKLKREQERAEADAIKRAELLKQREAKRIAFQMSLQSGRKGARFKVSCLLHLAMSSVFLFTLFLTDILLSPTGLII